MGGTGSDVDSEEENEEGDYTVYECPGLAPVSFLSIYLPYRAIYFHSIVFTVLWCFKAGEMEVKNPLFDETPVVTPNPATQAHDPHHLPNGHWTTYWCDDLKHLRSRSEWKGGHSISSKWDLSDDLCQMFLAEFL